MTDRNPPSAAFWITVALVVVLVGYPLSFGPACWVASHTNVGENFISTAYTPIICLSLASSRSESFRIVDEMVRGYADLAAKHRSAISENYDGAGNAGIWFPATHPLQHQ